MITIVSLAWNEWAMTGRFLAALKKHTKIPHKLVFTNNGSTQPISSLVLDIYPEATLIEELKNIGCPATRNEAMEHVDTDIVFWLDNDCLVGPNWYKPILDKLEDDSIGISGPQGHVVNNPWQQPYPFTPVESGDCDYFMGWLMGFKRDAFKPINDYNIPVNLDDVELCFGVTEHGLRAVVSDPCFALHLTTKTKRGWEFDEQAKLKEMWANWPDKSIFERFK